MLLRRPWPANAIGVSGERDVPLRGDKLLEGALATVPETENRQSIGIFLQLRSERYEEALCKYRLRREPMKSRPPMNKPTNVRAKTPGSGVDTVLVVTSN